jgi:hypothetical protein
MYQSLHRSMPSGLAWTNSTTTSSRKRSVSGSLAAEQLVDGLGHRLGAEHLGRVQPAVDPHDRLALGGQLRRLLGVDLDVGHLPRDVLQLLEALVVLPAR